MTACRSCGSPIVWGVTAKGKSMPLDAAPSMEGTVLFLPGRGDRGESLADVLAGERLEEARLADAALRTSHFATCPEATSWRRK